MNQTVPFVIDCPYCGLPIEIISFNCRIYRHGYFKKNMRQLGQHIKESTVDNLLKQNNIIPPCGRQFKIHEDGRIEKTTGK